LPVVGGLGLELVIDAARGEIIFKIKKPVGQRRRRARNDAGNFHALSCEKVRSENVGRDDKNFAGGGNKYIRAPDFGHADAGDVAPVFRVVADGNFQARRLGQFAAHGDERGFVAELRSQIVWRNDGGVTDEIRPAGQHEQRPEEKRAEPGGREREN